MENRHATHGCLRGTGAPTNWLSGYHWPCPRDLPRANPRSSNDSLAIPYALIPCANQIQHIEPFGKNRSKRPTVATRSACRGFPRGVASR